MPSRLTFCGVRRVARGSGDAHHVTRAIGQARPLIRAAARSQTGPRQLPRTQPPPCVGRLHWVPGRTAATARLYRRPSPSRRCPARRPRPATAPTRNPSSPTHPFLLPFASPPPPPRFLSAHLCNPSPLSFHAHLWRPCPPPPRATPPLPPRSRCRLRSAGGLCPAERDGRVLVRDAAAGRAQREPGGMEKRVPEETEWAFDY